jgi:hypothetical protein
MPIPALDENGLLPVGVHGCTLAEIAARFGVFQRHERRARLMTKLDEFVAEARVSGIVHAVIVDGSFVTDNSVPNDIDLILVLRANHDLSADLAPLQYNLVSKNRVRRRYGFDTVAVRDNSPAFDSAVAFFQQVRGQPGLRKAILRIEL